MPNSVCNVAALLPVWRCKAKDFPTAFALGLLSCSRLIAAQASVLSHGCKVTGRMIKWALKVCTKWFPKFGRYGHHKNNVALFTGIWTRNWQHLKFWSIANNAAKEVWSAVFKLKYLRCVTCVQEQFSNVENYFVFFILATTNSNVSCCWLPCQPSPAFRAKDVGDVQRLLLVIAEYWVILLQAKFKDLKEDRRYCLWEQSVVYWSESHSVFVSIKLSVADIMIIAVQN